ncbi:hypothetical protein GCM10020331_093670 [Ectobacillus funiculus]
MLGIGGSIINYPMLLYIPPLFGIAAFSAHEVSGINAIPVFFSQQLVGFGYTVKGGYLNRSLIIYMGISILAGSFIGGYGSKIHAGEQHSCNLRPFSTNCRCYDVYS